MRTAKELLQATRSGTSALIVFVLSAVLVAAAPARGPVRSLRITTLSTMLADEGIGEWGFAALVEVDGRRILFDTGARPRTVLENARELKVDLAGIDRRRAEPQPRRPHGRALDAAAGRHEA